MPWPRILVALFGLFCIASGIEAYTQKQSLASLMGGGGIGVLVLVCFFMIPKQPRWAYIAATVLAFATAGRFASKAFGAQAVLWPGQIIFWVSIGVAVALVAAHFLGTKKHATPA